MSSVVPGATIADRFWLARSIALGGSGEVWQAKDRKTRRIVAVKILRSEHAEDDGARQRFRREVETVDALDHPSIARFIDFGAFADDLLGETVIYLVTEYVRGESLDVTLARSGRLSVDRVLSVLEQTARALGHAHAAGIVHRGIKPSNLLVTKDGSVKLTDFGIATIPGAPSSTNAGIVLGAAVYMSPEQALGEPVTAASDVYSLAAVGYELLTGQRLFTGQGAIEVADKHVDEEPPTLSDEFPEPVRRLVARALDKDPARRPRNGAEFADVIEAIRAGYEPAAWADVVERAQLPQAPTGEPPQVTAVMPVVERGRIADKIGARFRRLRRTGHRRTTM